MTERDTTQLEESTKILWGSEVLQLWLNIEHQFQTGYSAGGMVSLRMDFQGLLPAPEGKRTHRKAGALEIRASGVRLECMNQILVGNGDSPEKVLATFPQLVGRELLQVEISPPAGDSAFVFDNDLKLRCFHADSQGRVSWRIATPNDDNAWTWRSLLRGRL